MIAHLRIIIGLLLLSAFVSSILCVYIYVKSQDARNSFYLLIGQVLVIAWNILYIFELLAPTIRIRWIIIMVEYFPICFLGVVLFHFAYRYTQNKRMNHKLYIASFIPPVIGYLSVLTNSYHYQFYKEIRFHMIKFGFFTYYILGVTAAYLFAGALFFLFRKNDKNPIYRMQGIYYSIAILIPLIVHVTQLLGIIRFEFMLTLLFLPVSMFILTVLIIKYQFLDIIPSAINRVIDNTMDGMLIINNKGNIIDYNTWFFEKKFDMYDIKFFQTMENFLERLRVFSVDEQALRQLEKNLENSDGQVIKDTLKIDEHMMIYYTVKPLMDYRRRKIATLITFFDMTEIYMLYNELEVKNSELISANKKLKSYLETVEKLTIEEEINRILTEIHDTLGHSMTELLALIEVTKMLLDSDAKKAEKTLQTAIEKARKSLEEIRVAVAKYKKMGGRV